LSGHRLFQFEFEAAIDRRGRFSSRRLFLSHAQ
jgi:hypothetical protein